MWDTYLDLKKVTWYETIANRVLVGYGAKIWSDLHPSDLRDDLMHLQCFMNVIYKLDLYSEEEENAGVSHTI
jgi:hypothetical protein